jgi:hypothetical protein
LLGTSLSLLGIVGVVALILALPVVWLRWEAAEAHARAVSLTEAALMRAQDALTDLFTRFERATASLRAQDLSGDTVSLTGRLLRAEPLIAPAAGLQVVNSRGLFVASSSVGAAAVGTPVWWFRALPLPQSRAWLGDGSRYRGCAGRFRRGSGGHVVGGGSAGVGRPQWQRRRLPGLRSA